MSSEEAAQKYYILGLAVNFLQLLGWAAVVASTLSLLITLASGPVALNSITIGEIESGVALLAAATLALLSQAIRVLIDTEENTRRSYRAIEELVAEIKLQNEPVLFEMEETPIDLGQDEIT